MSPREAADRLYDRVMRTLSSGDTAGAMAFQPMGVQAYELAEPLDLDGIYHLAMLQMLTDRSAALATSERILEVEPDHILGLSVAAEASARSGDEAAATTMYRRLLAAYDAQQARPLNEYLTHRGVLVQARTDAEAYLAGR
jgi:hypothetical protein